MGCLKLTYQNFEPSLKVVYKNLSFEQNNAQRFLSLDPLAADFASWSPYNYVLGNPIRYIDPDGRAPQDPIGPGYYGAKVNSRTLGFIARNPIAGAKIGLVSSGSTNISTNAVRFSTRIGLQENGRHEGSQVNAFRHVLWQSTITNQFGGSVAKQIGGAHEENPFAISGGSQTSFKTSAGADESIDLLNNVIGRKIGADNPNANMQELALKTLDYFKENGFYTSTKQEDGTYTIGQTKITDAQYNNGLETINGLNKRGFTSSEQGARDAAAKKKIEQIDRGPKF
jgi:RHS repeat-associated protein